MNFLSANRPIIMGGFMGLMMLAMAHQQIVSPSALQGAALASFLGAHVAILLVILGGTVFAARLHPRLQKRIAKLHHPSWAHLRGMAAGMAISAGLAHLVLHGAF